MGGKIGLYLPEPSIGGSSTAINTSGLGRITAATRERIFHLISESGLDVVAVPSISDAAIINDRVILNNADIDTMSSFFWYGDIDRREGSFELDVLRAMTNNINVFRDPYKYSVAVDKYKAFSLLRAKGVSVPDCAMVGIHSLKYIENVFDSWGALLMKPTIGGYGRGVTLFQKYATFRDVAEYVSIESSAKSAPAFYVERFYENDTKHWLGITIINNTVAYGYKKDRSRFVDLGNGYFKVYSSSSKGGGVTYSPPPEDYKVLALAASRELDLPVIGFDIIRTNRGPMIIDVNTFPGMYDDLFGEANICPGDLFFKMIMHTMPREALK